MKNNNSDSTDTKIKYAKAFRRLHLYYFIGWTVLLLIAFVIPHYEFTYPFLLVGMGASFSTFIFYACAVLARITKDEVHIARGLLPPRIFKNVGTTIRMDDGNLVITAKGKRVRIKASLLDEEDRETLINAVAPSA